MAFVAPTKIAEIPTEPEAKPYNHGYTEEQVHRIELLRSEIIERDIVKEPVTLEEFRGVIAPWFRIHRTTEFILHPIKEKVIKETKAPKTPKVKKLTKKQREAELSRLILKMAMGQEFTPEETMFYNNESGE
jgi:hypothetical protein